MLIDIFSYYVSEVMASLKLSPDKKQEPQARCHMLRIPVPGKLRQED